MERKTLFNDGWKFTKQKIDTAIEQVNIGDFTWEDVDLPHDWLIYNTNDLYETSEGWYHKKFIYENLENKVVHICFDGVYMDSTVYINGCMAGEWKYGYSSFELDITQFMKSGINDILVRVIYQSPNTRWYSGAGIYRNVWLKTTGQIFFASNGTYITTRKEEKNWEIEIEAEICNYSSNRLQDASVMYRIVGSQGEEIATANKAIQLLQKEEKDVQKISIEAPIEWSQENPYLYTLHKKILINEVVVEEEVETFGFRTIRFDSEEGFFLNDKHVKLHGACQHHDLGALGSAVNQTAIRRQINKLKEMGVNAIRLTHNMPSVEMMELADEMGILIVSEAFDIWEWPKNEYDYARYFDEWCEKDIASWIRRDRNHPSIIMWSIGNEIPDTTNEKGIEITKRLKGYVLSHDSKKNGQVTIGSNHMTSEFAQQCSNELVAAGYNYAERLYEEQHKKYPHWVIYGSETASTIQSRGVYHFPANKKVVMYEDEQCSSLDNCTTSWGAKSTQYNLICDRDASFSMGQFIWSGFDYIGEPTPYTTKNSYFGQIDTAGFPKDSFYLYQAEWMDYKVNPMVHVLPYWDFNEGQLIDVLVYSNAPKVELFFNEKSQGVVEIDHKHGKELAGKWQLSYSTGEIEAVAYDEVGNIIARDIQKSFGDAAEIVCVPDKKELMADGQDLIFIDISVVDEAGVPVANANNRVEVLVKGAGRLVGLDNGDSTDYDQYKGTSRRLFNGKLLAIIAAKTTAGEISVEVSSPELPTQRLILQALPCEVLPGITASMENEKSKPLYEIPIRKIALINQGSNQLSKENPTTTVVATLYPTNTTYQEIEWKAVNTVGIETNIVEITGEGSNVKVTALGDGEFRLRAIARNGGKIPKVLSDLEFEITGMGTKTICPYQFITAGLHNVSNYELDNGISGGIDTRDNTMTVVGFEGLDFGEFGTNEVILQICYWANNAIPVEIWEGVPGNEGAVKLLDTTYQANWIWDTFQPNTYSLPKKLKKITTVSFVFYHKLNFKGVQFTKRHKAFERLEAKENNQIYGDSFEIAQNAILHIGNNVIISYDEMDFGDNGASKIKICGKSNINNNIHIVFEGEESNQNQIIDFIKSEDYVVQEFKIDEIRGLHKVGFLFLPGCNFDFQWFQFEK